MFGFAVGVLFQSIVVVLSWTAVVALDRRRR